jgi:hypothetical protein
VKKIWWTWDLRTRWARGFSGTAEEFVQNYRRAIDAARRYGVDGIVIWGFLRDRHGGVEAARRVRDYAGEQGVMILPGVGIDSYGGVYYQGDSPHALNVYLTAHPGARAVNADGSPQIQRWPPSDASERFAGCPSDAGLMDFYRESIDWLVDTFHLDGFQIEQGDVALCHCPRCRGRKRTGVAKLAGRTCLEDLAGRVAPVAAHALARRPNLVVIAENYSGLLPADAATAAPFLRAFPPAVYHSWQAYDAEGRFFIAPESQSPAAHGCLAVRTNSDAFGGELADVANIRKAVALGRGAGLDMTYIYGEYPDDWPATRANYQAWAQAAAD